jgi:hypothetical protein
MGLETKLQRNLKRNSSSCHQTTYLLINIYIVTYKHIARQRFGKHIPAEAYARNSMTFIARQRIIKEAF